MRRAPSRARCLACVWWTSPTRLVVARETARRAAQTDIVAYVDADCRAPITWLERVEAQFSRRGAPVAVTGPYRYYDWDWRGRALVRLYEDAAAVREDLGSDRADAALERGRRADAVPQRSVGRVTGRRSGFGEEWSRPGGGLPTTLDPYAFRRTLSADRKVQDRR